MGIIIGKILKIYEEIVENFEKILEEFRKIFKMWKTFEEIILEKFGEILKKCEYLTSFEKLKDFFRFFIKFLKIFQM